MDSKKELARNGVFALGNFDGVHRGHRLVAEAAVAKSRELHVPSRVLTFEPHPRSVFQPGGPPFRLTTPQTKEALLLACGIDEVVAWPFTHAFAQLSAQKFVEDILVARLGAQHIVAGHDFVFGHGRSGTMEKLADWLKPFGVRVTEITPLCHADLHPFSSSRVRLCLQQGDLAGAADILGRRWSISGIIIRGAQRGRTVGFPTANISLGNYVRPKFGVYAVDAKRAGEEKIYKGVANIGVRPTVNGMSENLEAHLFDFDQDIYGEEWDFVLTHFIRDEQKFETFVALTSQIALDAAKARSLA